MNKAWVQSVFEYEKSPRNLVVVGTCEVVAYCQEMFQVAFPDGLQSPSHVQPKASVDTGDNERCCSKRPTPAAGIRSGQRYPFVSWTSRNFRAGKYLGVL